MTQKKKEEKEGRRKPVRLEYAFQAFLLCAVAGLAFGLSLDPAPTPETSLKEMLLVATITLLLEMSGGATLHILTMWHENDFRALFSQDKNLWYYQREMDFKLVVAYLIFAVVAAWLSSTLLTLGAMGQWQTGTLYALGLVLGVAIFTLVANWPEKNEPNKETKNRF